MKVIRIILICIFFLGLFALFSFRLTRVPPGINIDESSIGYNACLIGKNLKDENGRKLPVFILTLGGKDWKQPIKIYSAALIFKLFGRSYFNLRLVSVIFAVSASFLFWLTLRLVFEEKLALIGLLLFVTSPSVLLQSHLALENIDLLPFLILWLYFLFSYSISPKPIKSLLAGAALGISFYTYKGMHALVPVYWGISLIYLLYFNLYRKKGKTFDWFLFLAGGAPFLIPLGWLQVHYAGAIFDPAIVSRPSFYNAAYIYLSAFDFSFLFLKGDKMLIHSTGYHGMFLLPTIILFFLGFLQMAKEKKPWYYFAFAALVLTPLLLTTVGSVYRASRLMAFIPLAVIIFTLGFKKILEFKNKYLKYTLLVFFALTLTANFIDFAFYYWFKYPKFIAGDFSPNFNQALNDLRSISTKNNKIPYIEYNELVSHKTDLQFFSEVYFPDGNLKVWQREKEDFPDNAFVLTSIEGSGEIVNFKKIPSLESGQKELYLVGKSKK